LKCLSQKIICHSYAPGDLIIRAGERAAELGTTAATAAPSRQKMIISQRNVIHIEILIVSNVAWPRGKIL